VHVVDHAAAQQLEQQADPDQLGVVEMADVGTLAPRRPEHPPCHAERPVDAVAGRPHPDHAHAGEWLLGRPAGDQRDVVAGPRQACALPMQDPRVLHAVHRGQMADPRAALCDVVHV
jgi:hypothetical protein